MELLLALTVFGAAVGWIAGFRSGVRFERGLWLKKSSEIEARANY